MLFPQDDFNIRDQNFTTRNGVSLTLFPAVSGSIYGLELQRAPDNNGSPGTFVTIATVPATALSANGTPFFDQLGVNGQILWYQDRHIDQNGNASAWSTAVSAIAKRYVVNAAGVPIGTGVVDLSDPGNLNVDGDHIARTAINPTKIGTVIGFLQDTGHLNSSIQDGAGRLVQGFFHTGSNTLDNINNGSTYGKVKGAALDGSGNIDISTSAVINRYAANIYRSAGDITGLDAIVQQLKSVGGHMASTMQDGAGRLVQGMFHTGSNTLDNINNGSTYGKVKGAALDGSGNIDISTSAVINRYAANIYRSAGDITGLDAIVQQLKSVGGHMASTMQDGAGRLVQGMFHTGSNTADQINDGSSKRVTTLNEATGGGYGYSNLDSTGVLDGKLIRSRGWNDGSWAVVAQSSDGLQLNTNVADTAGRHVAGMFHTGSNSADNIQGGSVKRIPLVGATDGTGNIDMGGTAWINKNTDYLADGTSTIRTVQYAGAGAGNMLENANFEGTPTTLNSIPGYVASSAILTLDSGSNVFRGMRSLKVSASGQFGAAVSVKRWKVRPGEMFIVSGACRNSGANDVATIQFWFGDPTGSYQGGVQAGTSAGVTTWTGVSAVGTVPVSASYGFLSLQNNNPGGGVVWFDDLYLAKIADVATDVYRVSSQIPLGTIVQYVQDTGHLHPSIQAGNGLNVTGMFHTGSHTLDVVQDGSTYKKVTAVNASNQITANSSVGRDRCRMRNNVTQTMTNNVATDVTCLGTVDYDVGSLSTNANCITIPTGGNVGCWQITGWINVDSVAGSGNSISLYLKKSTDGGSTWAEPTAGASTIVYAPPSICRIFVTYLEDQPSAGYRYKLTVLQNTGADRTLENASLSAVHLW